MDSTRRNFFRAVPAAWLALSKTLEAATDNETYWALVHRQFPLEDGLTYLNAANVCPASRPVLDRHAEFLRDFQANPSFQNRLKYEALRERLREKIAASLRVSGEEIAITRNTSEGSNIVVKGVDLKPGDEVIITDHNHPSNNDAWKVRASRDGFTVKSLPVSVPAKSVNDLVAQMDAAITPRTKVIAITHVTSTTGVLYPAKQISELARRRGIWMHLDGAQTFGMMDINLKEIGCDSFSTSAHKWLMGPLEAGILYVRTDRIPQTWPSIVTAGWSDHLKGARKLEVYGQRDDPRIVALESAMDFQSLIGVEKIEARVRFLATNLKRQLTEIPGIQLKTNMEPELSGGVVKIKFANRDTKSAYDALYDRYRIAAAPTLYGDAEGVRFSPHIYNSLEDLSRAATAVRELARG
jgi:isopenicillin-N epimerase